MLLPNTLEEIATLVKAGFYDREDLLRIFGEEMYEPGELDLDEVGTAVDTALQTLAHERLSWPPLTDCDRLTAAFLDLSASGIIALENAGFTQDDGYDDFQAAFAVHPAPHTVEGYCFYHGQDVERAVRGGGLLLAFGPVRAADEATKGAVIGRRIQESLERQGLVVAWNGTFGSRLHMPTFTWQRR